MQVEAAEANGIETAAAAAVKIDHGRDDDDVQEDCCGRCLCRCHCRGRRRSGRHRRGRRPGRPGSLRTQLQFVLVSLFCWQSCVSVHKFLLGRVTSTFAQEHEERVVWPAVTVCPVDAEPKTRIRWGVGQKLYVKISSTKYATLIVVFTIAQKLPCQWQLSSK